MITMTAREKGVHEIIAAKRIRFPPLFLQEMLPVRRFLPSLPAREIRFVALWRKGEGVKKQARGFKTSEECDRRGPDKTPPKALPFHAPAAVCPDFTTCHFTDDLSVGQGKVQ
ncbi:hypothetical protein GW17_00000374 [Ensete ventricosum]|nr:hypothetical protein GW17_00000374 [Ensete ventricosum]